MGVDIRNRQRRVVEVGWDGWSWAVQLEWDGRLKRWQRGKRLRRVFGDGFDVMSSSNVALNLPSPSMDATEIQ